jgi:hypothetical protein
MPTTHSLIQVMEARSPVLAGLSLKTALSDEALSAHLGDFAQDVARINAIADTFEVLTTRNGAKQTTIKDLAKGLLTSRSFYGTLCEVASYGWLQKAGVDFRIQVARSGSEVLNANGTDVDGTIPLLDLDFDIKAFGLEVYLARLFCADLEASLKAKVSIEGPMDVGVKTIEQFLFREKERVITDLKSVGLSKIPALGWTFHVRAGPVHVSVTEASPYRLAEENRYYAFKTARQFSQTRPFILILAISFRFNPILSVNFEDSTDVALRSLARRTFLQFRSSSQPITDFDSGASPIPLSDAAALVSGMLFIDIDDPQGARFFLNPAAKHLVTRYQADQMFDFKAEHCCRVIEDFTYDVY